MAPAFFIVARRRKRRQQPNYLTGASSVFGAFLDFFDLVQLSLDARRILNVTRVEDPVAVGDQLSLDDAAVARVENWNDFDLQDIC